jgi:hypothetical protein
MSIVLREHELKICRVLLGAAKSIIINNPNHPKITLRIAGGWGIYL